MKTFILGAIALLAAILTPSVRLAKRTWGNAAFRFDQWLDRRKDRLWPQMANSYLSSQGSNVKRYNGTKAAWAQAAISQRYLLYALGTSDVATVVATPAIMPHGTIDDEVSATEVDSTTGYYQGAGVSGAPVALQILGNGLTKIMVCGPTYTPAYGDEVFSTSGGMVMSRPTAPAGTYWKVGVVIGIDMDSKLVAVSDCPPAKLVI